MTTRQTLIVTAGILLTVTGGIGAFVYSISKSETPIVLPFNLAEQRAIYNKKIMAAESEVEAETKRPGTTPEFVARDRILRENLAKAWDILLSSTSEADFQPIEKLLADYPRNPKPTSQDEINADINLLRLEAQTAIQLSEEQLKKPDQLGSHQWEMDMRKKAQRDLDFLKLARSQADIDQVRKWHAEEAIEEKTN